MPLADSEIRALKAGEKMKDFFAGQGLRVRLEPAKKGTASRSTGTCTSHLVAVGRRSASVLMARDQASGP